jgi:hypothetical protein
MSGITEIQSRIRDIQAQAANPPLAGRFNAAFEAQLASANARTAAPDASADAAVGEFVVGTLGSPASAVYGAETVPLGVMLGLTTQPAPPLVSGSVATSSRLAEYLATNNVTDRNGRLDLSELSSVSGAWNGTGYLLPPAAVAWEQMRAAAAADGIDLQAIDLYRTWESQNNAYQAHLRGDKVANVLPPGTSQHGLGLAVDVTNGHIIGEGDAEHAWLRNNANRFGWYPISNETWHWEFRGV